MRPSWNSCVRGNLGRSESTEGTENTETNETMRSRLETTSRIQNGQPSSNRLVAELPRRAFLKGSLAGTAGALLLGGVGGCGGTSSRTTCYRRIGEAHEGSVLALAINGSGTLLASGAAVAALRRS